MAPTRKSARFPSHLLIPLDWELVLTKDGMGAEFPRIGWRESDCSTCGGTKVGRTWMGAPLYSEVVEFGCLCVDQMLLHRYMGMRGITSSLRIRGGADLHWIKKETRDKVTAWNRDLVAKVKSTVGLMLTGDTGKTLIASLIQRWAINAGMDAWMLPRSLFGNDYPLFNWDHPLHETMTEMWLNTIRPAPVLILDRLEGGFGIQDRIAVSLAETIASRADNGLLTIVTTKNAKTAKVLAANSDLIDNFDEIVVGSEQYPMAEIRKAEAEHNIVRPAVLG